MSVDSRAIFSNFFGEQGRQTHPQYLSGLSRALFPTTFLETAVYNAKNCEISIVKNIFVLFPVLRIEKSVMVTQDHRCTSVF